MKDSEKELVKLRANYFNGVALVSLGAGGLAPFLAAASDPGNFPRLIIGLVFFIIGIVFSQYFHAYAQDVLRDLDKSPTD